MARLPLSVAIGDYDHVRDVLTGRVPVEGVELVPSSLPTEEIFYRFQAHREFDIAEMSLGKYVAMLANGDRSITALPVFPSRAFRHSMFYVRPGSGLATLADLRDARIGLPEWAQTATIYARGLMVHEGGVPLQSVEWFQSGVDGPGRVEQVALDLPAGVSYRPLGGGSLGELLRDGRLDVVLSAKAPPELGQGVERLFPDYRAAEEAWFRASGIYPVMHTVAVRTELLERHPWLAVNLCQAFGEAKRRSMERLDNVGVSAVPMPWMKDACDRMKALFGDDWFPYGLDANRRTLDAFCGYAHEQGVCRRRLAPEELFPATTLAKHRT